MLIQPDFHMVAYFVAYLGLFSFISQMKIKIFYESKSEIS